MASNTKKGKPAPTSKKPVVRRDGKPTLREKRAEKKALHAATVDDAKKIVVTIIDDAKVTGKVVASEFKPTAIAQTNPIGRPWEYQRVAWTDQLGDALFTLISTGHSMREIADMPNMPPLAQMLVWLADETHPFVKIRARGKETLVPLYEEMTEALATKTNRVRFKTEKQVVTKDGDIVWVTEYRESDNVERSKLAVQTLQWTLGHLKPKKHGRNPDLEGTKANEQLEGLFAALKAGPKTS